MHAMVTARVPLEIRDQVNAKLRSIGSSPTELVNAAYDYVLATGELPDAQRGESPFASPSRTPRPTSCASACARPRAPYRRRSGRPATARPQPGKENSHAPAHR